MCSGDLIEPKYWNEKAGDELAKCLADIKKCSKAMSVVPSPSGSAPGWGWVVTFVYGVLKNKYNMNQSLIFSTCRGTSIGRYRSDVATACMFN